MATAVTTDRGFGFAHCGAARHRAVDAAPLAHQQGRTGLGWWSTLPLAGKAVGGLKCQPADVFRSASRADSMSSRHCAGYRRRRQYEAAIEQGAGKPGAPVPDGLVASIGNLSRRKRCRGSVLAGVDPAIPAALLRSRWRRDTTRVPDGRVLGASAGSAPGDEFGDLLLPPFTRTPPTST
jgi:hypothetical protein